MAKVTSPLHSSEAHGQFGKGIIYQSGSPITVVRQYFLKVYRRSGLQDIVRKWFKDGLNWWKRMSAEEQFLWGLALKNYEEYSRSLIAYTKRWARCLFLHQTLLTKSFVWEGSPFPPSLIQMYAKDEIEGYDQIIADIETLTGLEFCFEVKPFFFPYLGTVKSKGHPGLGLETVGLATAAGVAIALDEDYYNFIESWFKKQLVAHELTHALMNQHDWYYNDKILMSEIIANDIGNRVADGELEPIYTYQGKTLSEWVPKPGCE